MAVVAVVFASIFWTGWTEYAAWLPLLAALFALAPAIIFLKMPRDASPKERNKTFLMAWVLLVAMLVVFTVFSSTTLA
ncbi:hypothetical protein [Parasphingopyxis marina]|uniref:Uncharacterized protein n=1 Tax=Parasphingopyxis marina TaxID=2761622 RepID=A0A842HY46_9SPHN|nr:hypothetical protein [Parasphingopyxis marina]MBC2778026.1 hypothetical protein [Parasphingopyxis marina]